VAREARTRTRLDPETRREQIIDAAELVFVGRDPAEVTLEQVAAAAGVSRALVHNYFGDKSGLIAAVYLRSFQRLDAELARTPGYDGSGEDRVRATVDGYLRFARANQAAWALIATAEAIVHPEVQAARRARAERMAVEWGGTPEAGLVAHGVLGLLESATLEWITRSGGSIDRARGALVTLLWHGLAGFTAAGPDADRRASPGPKPPRVAAS
jgi:AcrR family transcriptional regulator